MEYCGLINSIIKKGQNIFFDFIEKDEITEINNLYVNLIELLGSNI